jgi:hypothetical protein
VESAGVAFTLSVTTWLNIVALAVSALLVRRFFATGGGPMLRMMDEPMGEEHDHSHHEHHHGHAHAH